MWFALVAWICRCAFCGVDAANTECDFKRVDGKKLKPSKTEMSKLKEPWIVRNAFAWNESMASREVFAKRFGHHTIDVSEDKPFQARYGASPRHQETVAQWMDAAQARGDGDYTLLRLDQAGNYEFGMDILQGYGVPSAFQNWLTGMRYVTLGVRQEGIALHNHSATYEALLTGRKRWYVFPPQEPGKPPVWKPFRSNTEKVLARSKGVRTCVQQASEIVVLPPGSWHTTFELDDWNVGVGAQPAQLGFQPVPESERMLYMASMGNSAIFSQELSKEAKTLSLCAAASAGHVKLSRALLDRGAGLGAELPKDTRPLNQAIAQGHLPVVELLLEHGADLYRGSLHDAAFYGNLELLRHLLDQDVRNAHERDNGGRSTLIAAAQGGHHETAKFLIDQGMDAGFIFKNKRQALHLASGFGHTRMAEVLVHGGAEVHAKDEHHSQSLHVAAANGHLNMTEMLLTWKADVHAKNKHGRQPLHMAAYAGHKQISRHLLRMDAGIGLVDGQGHQPLHLASHKGHEDVVKLLLKKGAETTVKSDAGRTPRDEAVKHGHVLKLLKDHEEL